MSDAPASRLSLIPAYKWKMQKNNRNVSQLVGRIGFISMALTWWITTGAMASEFFQEAPTREVVAVSGQQVP